MYPFDETKRNQRFLCFYRWAQEHFSLICVTEVEK